MIYFTPTWLLKLCLTLTVPLLVFLFSSKLFRWKKVQRQLKEKQGKLAVQKRKIISRLEELGISTDQPQKLTRTMSAVNLRQQIAEKRIRPTELLHACQAQAIYAVDTLKTGGLAEFICEAEKWADELESWPQERIQAKPLYGLPISLKESVSLAGYDSPIGLIKNTGKPNLKDCVLTRVLKLQGAIPFAITAMPPTGLSMDSSNPVYGEVSNPHSKAHSAGGSSGGEGTMIGSFASPFGIGTDIGGSIRIPAAFCGIAGLKPTENRLSIKDTCFPGRHHVLHLKVCIGPMARTVDDLVLLMRSLLTSDMFERDRYVVPLPFNSELYEPKLPNSKKLTIGYYYCFDTEDCVKCVPGVRRCIDLTRQVLQAKGHTLVEFKIPRPEEAHRLTLLALCLDGGKAIVNELKDEPQNFSMKKVYLIMRLPRLVKRMLIRLSGWLFGLPVAVSMAGILGVESLEGVSQLTGDIIHYRELFQEAWGTGDDKIDVLIGPTMPMAAPRRNEDSLYILPAAIYTMIYNLLDWPAGSLPAARITSEDIEKARREASRLRKAGDYFNAHIHEEQMHSMNLPLGVQVIAPPYMEELILRVMKELEGELHFWGGN